MKNKINISIFGLNLSTINKLKIMLEDLLSYDYQLNWTNIADPHLQILILNHHFFDLPNIKNIKHKNLFILKTINNAEYSGEIIDNTLHLPLTDSDALKRWLLCDIIPYLDIQKNIVEQKLEKHTEKLNYSYFQDIFSLLKKENAVHKFILMNDKNKIALIDTQSQEIWTDENLKKINASLHFVHADLDSIVAFRYTYLKQDLKQGIWQLIWENLSYETPIYEGCYHLKHWPQPVASAERKDLLTIAAYLQQGNTVQYIQQQMNISGNFIHRFIFTCFMADMIEEIPASAVKNHANKSIHQYGSENTSGMRSFFNKLRKKLGL
ncbi:hypothetical protein AY606_03950 [Acinetobacter sp. SFB]|uniref:hypothetical protein n=1 Tax=Acinetobacter sp. SFB TaxID=1805634 RepID=UPI0007D75AF0|nr:hypothetical protein [Acinetobacter sp. SFB]OAL79811.1 hypothetical protein AY606_03950 [Acinetobacter sp. SFB]